MPPRPWMRQIAIAAIAFITLLITLIKRRYHTEVLVDRVSQIIHLTAFSNAITNEDLKTHRKAVAKSALIRNC
ncbi:uncharacterized protein PHALS_15266 [Plasmopara halstedii]|uniref:Uncharacterized protein n=1 Tax=Plasmopara halstedii TaxID=4781 RepID=A0A0N7L8M2_PLAHL|nr:uncharacterized protein PHALS_15266 [Plasmopara halstedii]CEG50267.1 hypothetical protein PHALS_15266 [Plasmopara halstedii]|eukprot:XP_024586636.1 hypothetical protein PHALS_15266 [Plasmopara halstedii]